MVGGENTPVVVMVPEDVLPPTTPSTAQVTLPPLPPVTLKGCVRFGVRTETRGAIENPTPVPVRATVCGVPAALSSILIEALRVPAAAGVNVTVIVQLAWDTRDAPQLFVCEKSLLLIPVRVMPVIPKTEPPVLVSVATWDALVVPVDTLPKPRVVGFRETHGNELPVGLFISA